MAKVRKKKRQGRGGNAAERPPLSVGERLRQAREAQGLEIAVVAERLHLKQSLVIALENEDFDRLPARVFVRGYYRNYARLLELPEERLLQEFDARCPEGEECAGAPPVVAQGVRREIRSSHGLVRLVTWVVIFSLLAAFGWWWKDRMERQAPPPETPAGASAPAQEEAPPAAQEGPAEERPSPAASPAGPEVTEEAPSGKAPEAVNPASEAAAPAFAATVPASAPEKPPRPAPPPRVELRFLEDSWVDVRGAHGSFKLVGMRKAGESVVLGGEPPYNMILGNARGVRLLVNGRPYDLSSKTRRNVARLTLKP